MRVPIGLIFDPFPYSPFCFFVFFLFLFSSSATRRGQEISHWLSALTFGHLVIILAAYFAFAFGRFFSIAYIFFCSHFCIGIFVLTRIVIHIYRQKILATILWVFLVLELCASSSFFSPPEILDGNLEVKEQS